MATFDPTDLKYQVDPAFPPDKESAWTYPPEKDGWAMSHLALTSEIRIFGEAFESIKSRALLDWEVKSIQTAFAGHYQHVTWHHNDEDDNVVPFFKKRFVYPERLESDHPKIEALGAKVKTKIEGLKPGDRIDDILMAWKKYGDMIVPHMDEENATALLLMRAYFTPQDLKPMIEYIIKNGPKVQYLCNIAPTKFFEWQEGSYFFVSP
jgi:hemerythrin-like domain-containing protein